MQSAPCSVMDMYVWTNRIRHSDDCRFPLPLWISSQMRYFSTAIPLKTLLFTWDSSIWCLGRWVPQKQHAAFQSEYKYTFEQFFSTSYDGVIEAKHKKRILFFRHTLRGMCMWIRNIRRRSTVHRRSTRSICWSLLLSLTSQWCLLPRGDSFVCMLVRRMYAHATHAHKLFKCSHELKELYSWPAFVQEGKRGHRFSACMCEMRVTAHIAVFVWIEKSDVYTHHKHFFQFFVFG